ncbi:hypothetical protein QTP88_002888 [Uroleucon formosanum]
MASQTSNEDGIPAMREDMTTRYELNETLEHNISSITLLWDEVVTIRKDWADLSNTQIHHPIMKQLGHSSFFGSQERFNDAVSEFSGLTRSVHPEHFICQLDAYFLRIFQSLVAANITWYKTQAPQFRRFLEKYTGHHILDKSELRKNYLGPCHYNTLTDIKNEVCENNIWIGVDETTDTSCL